MRIAIGQLSHETNTMFGPPTPVEEFQRQGWFHGAAIVDQYGGARTYLGGMIVAGADLDVEIVPTFAAQAHPSGTIERAAFERMRDELLAAIRAAGEIDAVCLALHGAGSAEGVDDLEGTILKAVRELVGPDVPLIATLDLHCHSTATMIEQATALLTVHEYPHVDGYERGYEAIELAVQTLKGEVQPVMHLEVLPMTIAPTTSFHGPAREINERCWEWEKRDGVIDVTFIHGYPHTDVPIISTSVMAIADGDAALAREAAKAVATRVWETRDRFLANLPLPEEAIRQALATDGGPAVIAEVSDNPGGGSPGDGTHLLRAMLDAGLAEAAFGFIYDPETAAQAHAAGPGATIEARIGGKTDPAMLGAPVETRAYVKCVTDGQFITQSPMGRGGRRNLGKMARLVVSGVDVIVGSESNQTIDGELFLLHGIDVTRYKIVALKSQNHFLAGFEALAARIIRTDPPGWTTSNLKAFDYLRINRPIWPLDEGVARDV
ncbi:MAG TPA: M81 family metallopeptidase [Thermomicrobiales bacterium]|nr:M81 family metallopeptidase [Thermomicrobiales bacterium]